MLATQAKSRTRENKKRVKVAVSVGDLVWVHMPVQSSKEHSIMSKLAHPWRGPFRIEEVLTPVCRLKRYNGPERPKSWKLPFVRPNSDSVDVSVEPSGPTTIKANPNKEKRVRFRAELAANQSEKEHIESPVETESKEQHSLLLARSASAETKTGVDRHRQQAQVRVEHRLDNIHADEQKQAEIEPQIDRQPLWPMSKDGVELLPGSLAWAKWPRYPWWPVRVSEFTAKKMWPKMLPEVAETRKKDHILVLALGDQKYAWFPAKELLAYEKNFDELQQKFEKCRLPRVKEAIEQAARLRELLRKTRDQEERMEILKMNLG
eukprot:GILJ01009873.1.p1 GENE.GILJ01009873.1~~GILJ01009873.1.p1  ORF type:complete len:320 (-),score=30.89 GILJ01009873.1:224-1183(-)